MVNSSAEALCLFLKNSMKSCIKLNHKDNIVFSQEVKLRHVILSSSLTRHSEEKIKKLLLRRKFWCEELVVKMAV
jgi:hypothetical protein